MRMKAVRNVIVQVVCTALVFLLIAAFAHAIQSGFSWLESSEEQENVRVFSNVYIGFRALTVIYLCWFLLIFCSLFRLAFSYDPFLRRVETGEEIRFFTWIKQVVSTPSFWCELAVILVLLTVLPVGFLAIRKFFPIAIYPIVAAVFFVTYVMATTRMNVIAQRKFHPLEILNRVLIRFLLHLVALCVAYPVLLLLYSSISQTYGSGAVAAVAALLILTPFLLLYFRAVFKRRKMLKRLKRICKEKQYTITCKRVYRSILFPNREPEIRFRTEKATFACKLIVSFSKNAQLHLSFAGESDGETKFVIGRSTLVYRAARISFEPGEKRVLILVPAPTFVYGKDGNLSRQLYPADMIGGCTIYGSTDFLNALDRDVLEDAIRKREW